MRRSDDESAEVVPVGRDIDGGVGRRLEPMHPAVANNPMLLGDQQASLRFNETFAQPCLPVRPRAAGVEHHEIGDRGDIGQRPRPDDGRRSTGTDSVRGAPHKDDR
jgi:hypothetical protein